MGNADEKHPKLLAMIKSVGENDPNVDKDAENFVQNWKDANKDMKQLEDEAEDFITKAETDPFYKEVLKGVIDYETKEPSHPATHRFATRQAKRLGVTPEFIIVKFCEDHREVIMESVENVDDYEKAGKIVKDYLEDMFKEAEKDDVSMAAADMLADEEFKPSHPMMRQQIMDKAKKDHKFPEVEFVEMARANEGKLKEMMAETGISDMKEAMELAVGQMEAQAQAAAAEMAMEAETAMETETAEAQAYVHGNTQRSLTVMDYGTYFFAAVGVAFLAGKGFMLMKSKEYAVIEHDDSL